MAREPQLRASHPMTVRPFSKKPQPSSEPVRKDPKPRHTDGTSPWAKLANRAAAKHYCYVALSDQEAMSAYPAMGYVPEVYTEGGVRPAGGVTGKMGEAITVRGMLLMSISLERWIEVQEFGPDGDTGLAMVAPMERKIIDRRGENDPIRGPSGRMYIDFENETSAEEHVRA